MFRNGLLAATASFGFAVVAPVAHAKTLELVGVALRSPPDAFFAALIKGAAAEAKQVNPNARVTSVSADRSLDQQSTQIDKFIASGVNVIILSAVNPKTIRPAIERAQKAGVAVVAVHDLADGADAAVETDDVEAGRLSCEALAGDIGDRGNVVIDNGPQQVSAVSDRVKGCEAALARHPDIKLLASDQNGKGSRDGGQAAMHGYLARYPDIAGVFAINDPQAIGSELAARQSHRPGIVITTVGGAPEIVAAMKAPGAMIKATAALDPYAMGGLAVKNGVATMNGNKPAQTVTLLAPKLLDQENLGSYTGWTQR